MEIKINEIPQEFELSYCNLNTYLVDGELIHWDGENQSVVSPAIVKNEKGIKNPIIGSYPLLTKKEAEKALNAAYSAYDHGNGIWPSSSVDYRINCLRDFVEEMLKERGKIIRMLMWEIGKNFKDAEKEFDRTVEYIDGTITEYLLKVTQAQKSNSVKDIAVKTVFSPLGVVYCMGPYNYPLNETFALLIPALIMGNTVLFKPPKYGVLLHGFLLKAFKNTLPKGVVNVIFGSGRELSKPIMSSGKISVLAFIGSTKAALALKQMHPNPNRLRSVLGLEAKNPAIVLKSADIDQSVDECINGALSFNGQRCTALKIIFVHKDIADVFNEKFSSKIQELKYGMPWDKDVKLTPLPEKDKIDYLNMLVDDALERGARIINNSGGQSLLSYYNPAVLFPCDSSMKVYHEEQFGPVIPIVEFSDKSEVLEYVQNSSYGQQTSIFGKNTQDIHSLSSKLSYHFSRININAQCQRGPDTLPFTGRKDSAEGVLSLSEALDRFSTEVITAIPNRPINDGFLV